MFKKLLILVLFVSFLSLGEANVLASPSKFKNETIKVEKAKSKAVNCYNCPCNCLIEPDQVGECGQYKNVDGKIVPVEKNPKSK